MECTTIRPLHAHRRVGGAQRMDGRYDLRQVNADGEYHEAGAGNDDFKELGKTQAVVPTELVSR